MIRLAVRVAREHAELALAELLVLAPAGVEERDLEDTIEYAIYGAPGELPELPDLRAAAGDALVEVSSSEVPDDWAERWRRFHTPVVVGGRLRVRPPWAPPQDGSLDIVIEPGQAFGTGAHATTRLCLELMLELRPGGVLVDAGCGSGVLAIAGAKLGWSPVLACDNDPESVAATRANAEANGVRVDVRRLDLREAPLPAGDVFTANLLRPLLLALAKRMPEPGPRALVAGGLLLHEADEVADAFAAAGLQETSRREDGDWSALLMARCDGR